MGDYSGTIPTFITERAKASKFQEIADYATASVAAGTTWSPTLTSLTLGNGTLLAHYRRLGKWLWFEFKFTFGSSGSAVGAGPSFTLPYSAASPSFVCGYGWLFDSSTSSIRPAVPLLTSATDVGIQDMNHSTGVNRAISSTVPWTWAQADTLHVHGRVELS